MCARKAHFDIYDYAHKVVLRGANVYLGVADACTCPGTMQRQAPLGVVMGERQRLLELSLHTVLQVLATGLNQVAS